VDDGRVVGVLRVALAEHPVELREPGVEVVQVERSSTSWSPTNRQAALRPSAGRPGQDAVGRQLVADRPDTSAGLSRSGDVDVGRPRTTRPPSRSWANSLRSNVMNGLRTAASWLNRWKSWATVSFDVGRSGTWPAVQLVDAGVVDDQDQG
jgi:hypothetical protein